MAKSILETCKPREDIISGSFNPEIFTANLSDVIAYYRDEAASIDNIYTDAEMFFRQGTYPTTNLRHLLAGVFGRLKGDPAHPAIHRLETAFGGGKTHALIACTHIAKRGKELANAMGGVLDPGLLPEAGEITVVGVRGDEIPVHEPHGIDLIPYTLWGEIAYQIGGQKLYASVGESASSRAAPGKHYFDTVFSDRKVLILIDELAQYAARLEAAQPGNGEQLAAFIMALHGYARSHVGIVIVATLAGRTDAFALQTKELARLLSEVRGEEIDEDEAMSIGQGAVDQVESVAFRDAAPGLVPVQPGEISRVLAQRLMETVDRDAAASTADEYLEMYSKNARLLPDEATRPDYRNRIVANYPFHPTLVDYLNHKLSVAENFQGTRGVLRVLALATRSLWRQKVHVPMIHACHLDVRDSAIAGELLGRTGSSDLFAVLNADIGGPDTDQLEMASSNAEEADRANPHPLDFPMHEYTWKTIFLHSLVGREGGLGSPIFGLTEQDALFSASFPGLTPPQVRKALEKIEDLEGGAYYLRHQEGRYYASVEPSVRQALSNIWNSLKSQDERIRQKLLATARKIVSPDVKSFHIEHDVSSPEHIPDDKTRPILALISLDAEQVDVEAYLTTRGPNIPRERQNLVFLLVPDTVSVKQQAPGQGQFAALTTDAEKALNRIQDAARWALAIQELRKRPQDYGVNPARLDEDAFRQRASEREKALETSVTEAYSSLWFNSASGHINRKEIRTAGGESGVSVIERIRRELLDDNEIITSQHTDQASLQGFQNLFFAGTSTPTLEELRGRFLMRRDWPVLESMQVFSIIIRAGIDHNSWCLFRMGSPDSTTPEEFYSQQQAPPLNLDLNKPDFCIIRPEEAKKRKWTGQVKPGLDQVKGWIAEEASEAKVIQYRDLHAELHDEHGEMDPTDVSDGLRGLVRGKSLLLYRGSVDQSEKPDLIQAERAVFYDISEDDVIITPSEASKRGWLEAADTSFVLKDHAGAERIVPLLQRIGSFYNRGATSKIDDLDIFGLQLEHGGRLRISLSDVSPESMQRLGELLEVLAGVVEMTHETSADLVIRQPDEDCIFYQELTKSEEEAHDGQS